MPVSPEISDFVLSDFRPETFGIGKDRVPTNDPAVFGLLAGEKLDVNGDSINHHLFWRTDTLWELHFLSSGIPEERVTILRNVSFEKRFCLGRFDSRNLQSRNRSQRPLRTSSWISASYSRRGCRDSTYHHPWCKSVYDGTSRIKSKIWV